MAGLPGGSNVRHDWPVSPGNLAYFASDSTVEDSGIPIGQAGWIAVTKRTNYSISASENSTHFNNNGATGAVTWRLPLAAAGLQFTFIVYTAQTVTITTRDGETLVDGDTFSGTELSADTPYCLLSVEADSTGLWIVNGARGTWS